MWELYCKEDWAPKNWCFWTVVLEKTLESPMDDKEIQPVHSKGDQSWVFFGRNDAKAETPVVWPPHVKSWLIGKDSDAGRDWGQEQKGMTDDEMVGWHHWLDGRESEWTPGDGDGQGGLACCSSWGRKESGTTEWLKEPSWTELQLSLENWGPRDGTHCPTARRKFVVLPHQLFRTNIPESLCPLWGLYWWNLCSPTGWWLWSGSVWNKIQKGSQEELQFHSSGEVLGWTWVRTSPQHLKLPHILERWESSQD